MMTGSFPAKISRLADASDQEVLVGLRFHIVICKALGLFKYLILQFLLDPCPGARLISSCDLAAAWLYERRAFVVSALTRVSDCASGFGFMVLQDLFQSFPVGIDNGIAFCTRLLHGRRLQV